MLAGELRIGSIVRWQGAMSRVVEADIHKGAARTGTLVHAKLREIESGRLIEHRFGPDEKLEDVEVEEKSMQYLYDSGDNFVFMDAQTYEQVELAKAAVGPAGAFLKENDSLQVEFADGRAIGVVLPKTVEIGIKETGPGIRGQTDTTFKSAVLENGQEILVPQFIETGDRIRVDVSTGKYLDRVRK